jgi:NIMA-interacting peptidyl-prolyl cis-trans isomerase 1
MLDTRRWVKQIRPLHPDLVPAKTPRMPDRQKIVTGRTGPKSPLVSALVAVVVAVLGACDGTITGIGRVPRAAETPLPAAPVETVARTSDAGPRPTEISAQHLVVMYKGSTRAPETVKRTREEARARAFEALARIKAGEDFDKVVAAYTDEEGGGARHGDLGSFTHDRMVKAFADAAFALEVGQVSTVIESPFGFHVIRRTE